MKIVMTTPVNKIWQADGDIILKSEFQVALESGEASSLLPILAGDVGDSFPEEVDISRGTITRGSSGFVEKITISALGGEVWKIRFEGKIQIDTVTMRGGIKSSTLADGREEFYANFAVPAEQLESFLPSVGDLMEWAGDDCYCIDSEVEECVDGSYLVKLHARKVAEAKCLSVICKDEHGGYLLTGARYSTCVWHSEWSVPTALLEEYRNMLGSYADWADSNCIITSCNVKQLSPAEYLVNFVACNQYSYQNALFSTFPDDRSDLGNRVDISVSYRDLVVSAAQAGFAATRYDYYIYRNGWINSVDCPLECTQSTRFPYYDRNIPTMVVCETKYYYGGAGENLSLMAQWREDTLIFNGSIGDLSAKWLKMDIKATDILDNEGKLWAKIDYYYRMPPTGWEWNENFFKGTE